MGGGYTNHIHKHRLSLMQLLEINDVEKAVDVDPTSTGETSTTTAGQSASATTPAPTVTQKKYDVVRTENRTEVNIFTRTYQLVTGHIHAFVMTPKVNTVLRNIATCVVNGAIELISYYFPAPLIPVIASLAAMNTFLGNFEKYKLADNHEYDPYMTQRFNRRMMNYGKETSTKKNNENDSNKS